MVIFKDLKIPITADFFLRDVLKSIEKSYYIRHKSSALFYVIKNYKPKLKVQ